MVTRTLTPDEVPFHPEVAYRFLNVRRSSEKFQQMQELVDEAYKKYYHLVEPRLRYDILRVAERDKGANQVQLDGGVILTGSGVYQLLEGATYAAPFVLSLGDRIDGVMKELSEQDFTEAYFLDGVASALADGVLEVLKRELADQAGKLECVPGYRYAPGYARWPIEEQNQIFALLKPDDIGVHLTDTAYMVPQKSLSGVFNLNPVRNQQRTGT